MTIAEWNYPLICRPPADCPEPTDQDYFDALCFQILSGYLILTEEKPGAPFPMEIKDLHLQECCIHEIEKINSIIMNGKLLSAIFVVTPFFFRLFFRRLELLRPKLEN